MAARTLPIVVPCVTLLACVPAQGEAPEPGTPRPQAPDPDVVVRVVVPEAYELANVAIAITEHGREDPWLVARSEAYHGRVLERFGVWAEHELIRTLDPLLADSYRNYYGFRDNAFSYRLDEEGPVHERQHFEVWREPDLFERLRPLVAEFAEESGFREFYRSQRPLYEDQVRRYRELVDLPGMAGWLHARFPDRRIAEYTVVLSPLVGGSHSVRYFEREAIMFVPGPDLPMSGSDEGYRRGMHARMVFTEIDHAYVNPLSDELRHEIEAALGDRRAWNSGDGYPSALATFNEYMTWGVFTLYAADTLDRESFRTVIERSEAQMEERRGFVRFRAFNRELLRLYRATAPDTVRELYPPMLRWLREYPTA